jgi:hypothetical protein
MRRTAEKLSDQVQMKAARRLEQQRNGCRRANCRVIRSSSRGNEPSRTTRAGRAVGCHWFMPSGAIICMLTRNAGLTSNRVLGARCD